MQRFYKFTRWVAATPRGFRNEASEQDGHLSEKVAVASMKQETQETSSFFAVAASGEAFMGAVVIVRR